MRCFLKSAVHQQARQLHKTLHSLTYNIFPLSLQKGQWHLNNLLHPMSHSLRQSNFLLHILLHLRHRPLLLYPHRVQVTPHRKPFLKPHSLPCLTRLLLIHCYRAARRLTISGLASMHQCHQPLHHLPPLLMLEAQCPRRIAAWISRQPCWKTGEAE